jgi:AcrR family transcriptional regulator
MIERRKREKEVRRDLAIDAAIAIYEEEGYHSITMEKIAERSELSRAALYLYFKNKEEILIGAIVSYADCFAQLLQETYDKRESIKEALLERLWECFQIAYDKDPVVFSIWQYLHQRESIANLSAELRAILYEVGAKVVGLQHKIVGYGVAEEVFVQCDYRTLAEVIWSTFLGIVYTERSKHRLSHKNHMAVTRETAREVLSRGVLNPSRKKMKIKSDTKGLMTDHENTERGKIAWPRKKRSDKKLVLFRSETMKDSPFRESLKSPKTT